VNVAVALLGLVAFMAVLRAMRVPARARRAVGDARQAVLDLRNPDLDEARKERSMRMHAARSMIHFLVIVGSSAVAVAVPAAALWVCARLGLVRFEDVLHATSSAWFLIAGLALALLGIALTRGRGR